MKRIEILIAVLAASIFAGGCGKVTSKPDSKSESWAYSSVYQGLTPLSEDRAKERAIHERRARLGTTDGVAIAVLPVEEQVDYFRVLVEGKLRGNTVTHSVLIHRFNAKGDKIEE